MPRRKTRVLVLFGGRSSEHEVSILSAASIIAAFDSGASGRDPDGDHPGRPVARRARLSRTAAAGNCQALQSGSCRSLPSARRLAWLRYRLPGPPRAVRRGRQDPGPAGDGRCPVCRLRGPGIRLRNGQGRNEAPVSRMRPSCIAACHGLARTGRGATRGDRAAHWLSRVRQACQSRVLCRDPTG